MRDVDQGGSGRAAGMGMSPDLRAAERSELEQLMARFLAGGGEVTALDHAGRVTGVATEDLPPPSADLPVVEVAPVIEAEVALIEQAPPCAGAALPPAVEETRAVLTTAEILAELRAIRAAAEALAARVNNLPGEAHE